MGYLILYNHALGRFEKAGNLEFHGETIIFLSSKTQFYVCMGSFIVGTTKVLYFVEAIGLFSVVTSQFNWVCCIVYVYSYLG